MRLSLVALTCLFVAPALSQQKRDLKIEKDVAPAPKITGVSIPRSYALVVGIANYKNLPASHQLKFPERDAEAIYSILISPEGGNFRAENVRKLIGEKATLANIRRDLEEWLPTVAREDDRVLIYFAGHGFVYKGKGYLAPADMDLTRIAETGYPMDSLGAVIGGKIRAKAKVLLTDSCHSGAITPSDSQQINRTLASLQPSLFSLTASRDREQSFESTDWGGGHGIFTYYVVKGLEGAADETGDGIVTADELAEYVHRNVREATAGKQNPTSDRGSFDPAMLLSYVPSHAKPGAPPPPKFGGMIIEANMDGVEVFVDGKSVGVVDKKKPLTLPGLAPGVHTVRGVKIGYEPDGPREETVYPGQDITVSIKILIARRRNKAAVDAFDKGLDYYNKGYAANYKKAATEFRNALALDPGFSQAALYSGRTYNALFEQEEAKTFFRRAIEIDPDYLEARASFGGMLLDIGDVDEAIRQFHHVVQRDPKHTLAHTLLAQAYRMKEMYAESIDSAQKAIRLAPSNPEPHLWMAESLRLSGSYEKSKAGYQEYLRLSDFDSKLAGQLNYYVVGFLVGMGKKKRAAQQDIWKDLRSLAYFGICDCERKLSRFDAAIDYCTRSLTYDPKDPYAHYALAIAFTRKANLTQSIETLPAALKHFREVLNLNADLAEAQMSKQNIANIEAAMRAVR